MALNEFFFKFSSYSGSVSHELLYAHLLNGDCFTYNVGSGTSLNMSDDYSFFVGSPKYHLPYIVCEYCRSKNHPENFYCDSCGAPL